MYRTCIKSYVYQIHRRLPVILSDAKIQFINMFDWPMLIIIFFFKLRDSNRFGSKVAIRSTVRGLRTKTHYYPLLYEVLRYLTTPVWLLCFTLYEFTRAVRFAIERGARFAPLYLARALQVVRAPCTIIPATILRHADKYQTLCLAYGTDHEYGINIKNELRWLYNFTIA